MITADFALKQLSRFAFHRGFDRLSGEENSELRKDFLWAVQTAETEEICERVISDIVNAPVRDLPKAASIRTAMTEENERFSIDQTAAQIEQWKREADAERARWDEQAALGPPPEILAPAREATGYEKVLEPILAQYRRGAWRVDPDGARHAALLQMWLTVNRENIRKRNMLLTEPGKMPLGLWEELCALQAKLGAG